MKAHLRSLTSALHRILRPDGHAVVLRQTTFWSRAILYTIVGTIFGTLLWACLAPLDEVVHAQGKLEPRGSVQDVQTPVPGVILEVLVKEGQSVRTGDPLVRLDPKVAEAEARSLEGQVRSLEAAGAFYEAVFQRSPTLSQPADLPPEVANLAKDHSALVAEDNLLRALIESSKDGDTLRAALNSDQIAQVDTELLDFEERLQRVRDQLQQAREIERKNAEILKRYQDLNAKNVASELEMMAREVAHIESVARVKDLESQEENLLTTFRKDARTRLGENTKRLAEIESNLGRARLSNSQQLAEAGSRLAAARETLRYHVILSPADGVVFEIVSSKPGAVVAAKDIVLKIVPGEDLIAKVDITNSEIGFVHAGMPCEVEVETFPKREFGYLTGEVLFVGSDALPPTEVKPFYSFPAKVSLSKQYLTVRGKDIKLQSGMAVLVNIKVRDRLVINIFLDSLLGNLDEFKSVR